MTNLNPLFTTNLSNKFTVDIDYTNGCKITISPDLVFECEWDSHDGLNICLIQWANHEFKNNPLAQAKLKEIKQSERVSLGYCSIADYGYYHVIAVGLTHVMALFQAMGYTLDYSTNENPKWIKQLIFSLINTKKTAEA